jgi:HK97 gp10 family phage protein
VPSNVQWFGHEVSAEIGKRLGQRVKKAGIFLRDYIKDKLDRSQPLRRTGTQRDKKGRFRKGAGRWIGLDPSLPGEYPKKVTGLLRRSIRSDYDPKTVTASIGSTVEYAKYLELGTDKMAPRPWLTLALEETADKITQIMLSGRID